MAFANVVAKGENADNGRFLLFHGVFNHFVLLNPFPNTPLWDRPKFKEAADDNWNVDMKGF